MKADWKRHTLGELCEVINGGTPKTNVAEYWGGEHLWITPAEMGKRLSPYVDETKRTITALGLSDSSARMLPTYAVILSSRAPIGHLVINTKHMCTNQGCKGLIPSKQIDHKFLYYYLSSIVDVLNSLGTGATFKELSGSKLKEVIVPVAPLAEQQRIVGLLDAAFAELATAQANAEKNLKNAGTLFESQLQSVFTQRDRGWVETMLGALADIHSGGTPLVSQKRFWSGNIPWYSSGELNATYTTDPERNVTNEGLANSSAKLLPKGSLLVGMYDTAALKMSILDRDGTFNQAVAGVRPNDKIDLEFVLHAINYNKPRLLLERRGVRQKNLSLQKIKEISIPLPSLAKQRTVVSRLGSVRAETLCLENIFKQKIAALEALKRSLLHQAFIGQL